MQKGIAVLPIVLLISVLIFEVAAAGTFILFISQQTGNTLRRQVEALVSAEAGINDAIIRTVRDKNFSSITPYIITVGSWRVSVKVEKNQPVVGRHRVTSTASAFSRGKTLRAILIVNATTGQVTIDSIVEI